MVSLRQGLSDKLLGVFIGGCVVPSFEQTLFAYLKKIPPEFELLRTFRYIVPLILLAAFSALWMIKNELHRRNFLTPIIARTIIVIASMCLLLAWGVRGELQRREFRSAIHQNISCWTRAQIVCPLPQGSLDYIGILDFVREKTPSGARIFSEGQDVAIRYYALRPLVYTYKDGAPLAYTNSDQLLRWSVQQAAMDKLAYIRKFPFRRKEFMKGVVELAKNSSADYLILSETYDLNLFYPDALEPIYSNDRYSLYKINP